MTRPISTRSTAIAAVMCLLTAVLWAAVAAKFVIEGHRFAWLAVGFSAIWFAGAAVWTWMYSHEKGGKR